MAVQFACRRVGLLGLYVFLSLMFLGCATTPACPPCALAPVITIPALPAKEPLPPWQEVNCPYALCTNDRDAVESQLQILRADANTCRAAYDAMKRLYEP